MFQQSIIASIRWIMSKGFRPNVCGSITWLGHTWNASQKIIVDTHDQPVCDDVWDLYSRAAKHLGPVSTMIERDNNMPPFNILLDELEHLRTLGNSIHQTSEKGQAA